MFTQYKNVISLILRVQHHAFMFPSACNNETSQGVSLSHKSACDDALVPDKGVTSSTCNKV